MRPFTQLADVAVDRASTKFSLLEVDAAGSINKTVPVENRIKKPQIDTRVGDCYLLFQPISSLSK